MKKLLILLFSLVISLNAFSVQKSDLEGKTFIYLNVDSNAKIHHKYLKNGSLKNFSVSSSGKTHPGKAGDNWWIKNNYLYIEFEGFSPIKFSFDFNNNKAFFDYGGQLNEMTILEIDGTNVTDDDWSDNFDEGLELELINTYVDYLILKNLNDRYGGYSDMDDIKKLMRSIQDHYENVLGTNIDNLWDKAVIEYEREYGDNISIFASFYSNEGASLYQLILMGFNQQANKVGASSNDVEKDF